MKSLLVKLGVILIGLSIFGHGFPVVNIANAQSTLSLQKMCAEEAKKFVNDITIKFACEYHYNSKLDKCFVKIVYFEKGATVTLTNVFENKLIGHYDSQDYNSKPVFCSVGGKNCNSWVEFQALIKPYMEE